MSTDRDFERMASSWLAEGPTELNDRVLDAALEEVHLTQQRRRWAVPRRITTMHLFSSALARGASAAIAAVILIGGSIYVLVPRGGSGAGPTLTAAPSALASPSPLITAAPSATAAPAPTQLATSGPIFPGAYIPQFNPGFSFVTDREPKHNCSPGFQCRGSIDANVPGWLDLEFGQPPIEVAITRVDKLYDPTHAGRLMNPPADLAAWIASRPGITVVSQKATTVGGLPGTQLVVRTGDKDILLGPISGVTDPVNALSASSTFRLSVITVSGHQILIALVARSGSIEELQPLVDSIVWD
jgi:hypothetical protein